MERQSAAPRQAGLPAANPDEIRRDRHLAAVQCDQWFLPSGRSVLMPVASGVANLNAIDDGSLATITYTEVVTMLNLRQKGPGSQDARRDQMNPKPDPTDVATGRFTLTVVGVDLAKNTVSVISGAGGAVRTYAANSIAKQDMLKKIKVGDVVIGMTTPLMITSIAK